MTDETTPAPQVAPWQEHYELKPSQAVSGAITPQGTVEASKNDNKLPPWERKYEEKPREAIKGSYAGAPNMANIDTYLNTLNKVESGGKNDAQNPNSTATGPFQFTEGTWRDSVKEAGLNYSLADRTDPEKARKVVETFTAKNKEQAMKDLGREPSNAELYIYHFLGRNGAGSFLNAPANSPADQHVSPQAAAANPTIFYTNGKANTVAQVYAKLARKF